MVWLSAWILLELIVVTAAIWWVIDPLYVIRCNQTIPQGFDCTDVYRITLGELPKKSPAYKAEESDSVNALANFTRIVDRIKQYPGVEASVVIRYYYPFSDSNSSSSYHNKSIEANAWNMEKQLKIDNLFLLDVKPMSDVRKTFFLATGDFNELQTRLIVVGFLLLNIFLGIIGTFWFRTAYRKAEMGLRLAVGSTRTSLRKLLITEGLILLGLAIIPAAVISFNIGKADLVDINRMDFTFVRFISGMLITYLLMAFMIILGIWYPARQAMKIQPAEVLHEQ